MGNQKRVHEIHLWSERRRGFSRQCCEDQAKTLQNITQTLYTKSSTLLEADGGQNEGYFSFLAKFQYTELEFEMWHSELNMTIDHVFLEYIMTLIGVLIDVNETLRIFC